MEKIPAAVAANSPKQFDRNNLSKENIERHLAALDVLSNVVNSNDTQDNIGLKSASSFLIDDILFPRPKVSFYLFTNLADLVERSWHGALK